MMGCRRPRFLGRHLIDLGHDAIMSDYGLRDAVGVAGDGESPAERRPASLRA
jgi:hypothetical protein